jgi:hypothetical protein
MVPTSRGDNQSESSHSPDRYRGSHHHQPTIHSRRRRRPATTQRLSDHYVRYLDDLHVMSVPPVVHPPLFVSIH